MPQAQFLQFARPVARAVIRPYAIKYRIGGVACSLSFTTEAERADKAAELVHSGVAITFVPTVV